MKWIRENIGYIPSFSAYERQVSLIEESVESNPDLCVEACKSLIEGICKTILTNKGVDYSKYDKFQVLVRVTIDNMLTESDSYGDSLSELSRRISAVAQKISEIRDSAGFASHGQDIEHVSISYSLALLTSRITDVIGGFIMHFYRTHSDRGTSRILYQDNQSFNDYYDEQNPIYIGGILISASEALYSQDREAYKEALFFYLEQLEKGELDN